MSTIDKKIVALLNGIAGKKYYGEERFTDEFLQAEIYPDMEFDEFKLLLSRFEAILHNLATSDMEFNQLEAYLTSQMKKKDSPLTQNRAAAVSKFWRSSKTKIENIMINKSQMGCRLSEVNWRLDMQTQAKDINEINVPSAVIQMKFDDTEVESVSSNTLQLELSIEDVNKMTSCLDDIEKALSVGLQ